MALSPVTVLLTDSDVIAALGDTTGIEDETITLAVMATIDYVGRYHSTPMTDAEPPTVAWPYSYKLGAVKLASGLVRGGLSAALGENEPTDMFSNQAFERVTDISIEQLLRIGRFALPRIS